MKKAVFNEAGTKQIVNTDWKEFNKQTNCITTGNAVCNTQLSMYIRPYSETKCNGYTFKPGELLEEDLKPFRKYDIPEWVLARLEDHGRKDSNILYMFSTYVKNPYRTLGSVRMPFLWVVTSPGHQLLDSAFHCQGRPKWSKWISAKEEILKYITEE